VKPALKIAIIGCGTAGPAAAALLARQGHVVTLFERAPECRAVGAGFLMQPSGMAVLEELGILEPVLAKAARVERLHVVDPSGRSLLDLHYGELGKNLFGAGLHRPVLLHHLLDCAAASGAEIRWGWEVDSVEKQDALWSIRTPAGQGAAGFDLLIIADGARSKFRHLTGPGGINRGYPWGAHWFIGKNNGVFPENELYQVVSGTRKLGGFLATGRELDGANPLVSLFWSIKVDDDAAWRKRPLGEWKNEILGLCPRAEPFLEQIQSWDDVLVARYGDVRMRRWHGDGVVVLGDAGHAMSPQLGQGVNLALADASCLARCLAEYPMQQALTRYDAHRRFQLRYYQLATRWLTPWFQSDYEFLTPVRRLFFSVSHSLPPARKFMTRTMAGLVGAR
jgi:2-polyprenyl-6-methoxyphenol hydroxylase-like FAD-dependent oxidoreductase